MTKCNKCSKTDQVLTLKCSKKHNFCSPCVADEIVEQFDKKRKSFLDITCPGGCSGDDFCFEQEEIVDILKNNNKKDTLTHYDNVMKTIPKDPKDPNLSLDDFCYTYNNEGKLVHSISGDKFHWVNQVHYDLLGDMIIPHLQKMMVKDYGMKEVLLPLDWEEQGLQKWQCNNIFMTEDALTNPERLMLLCQGSGAVRAGQWARALCLNDSIKVGAIFNYLKDALDMNMGIIVLNPNLNTATKSFQRPERERMFIRGKPKPLSSESIRIPKNENPETHITYVWDQFAAKAKAKDLVLVAHSYGGVCTQHLLRTRLEATQRLRAIAFTDAVHRISFNDPQNSLKFLKKNAINWVQSKKPLDTHEAFHDQISGCRCLSSGHEQHEYTSEYARTSVFKFLKEKLDNPEQKVCDICGKDAQKICVQCKAARYCSVDCQKKDWPEHKKVCKKV